MISVFHVISDTNIGGAGKVVLNFLKYNDKNKIACKIILPKNSRLKDEVLRLGYEVIEVYGIEDKSLDFKSIIQFIKIFNREKPHIVHTHASLSARIAAKICGTKIIYTRHWIGNVSLSKSSKIINNFFCDKAIAVSESVKDALVAIGLRDEKIILIYNGIEIFSEISKEEKHQLKSKYGIKDEILVGIVARLEEVKGHKYFFDAVKIINKKYKNIKFLVAGDGSLHQSLIGYAKEHNLNNVIFLGFVSDVSQIMNIIDINVVSSLQESGPLTIIEAMSLKIPSVATLCGGPSELIEHNKTGLLVPVQNPEKLAEGIEKLIEDEQLRISLGVQALNKMKECFTAKIMAEKTIKLYEEIYKGALAPRRK